MAEAHRCSEATPARRTYSIRSDAATVHDNGEQRLRDVLAELDRRDSAERETVELPVVELGEAGEGV